MTTPPEEDRPDPSQASPYAPPQAALKQWDPKPITFGRVLLGLLMLALGLIGLFMSLCGGYFALSGLWRGPTEVPLLSLAGFSIVAGIGLIMLAYLIWTKIRP